MKQPERGNHLLYNITIIFKMERTKGDNMHVYYYEIIMEGLEWGLNPYGEARKGELLTV